MLGGSMGVQVGLEGVPARLRDGLEEDEELLAMSKRIGTAI
ncbi:MAG TPA: hypothetical protein VFS89_04470 [Nitrosospira sp.]|nr:hypothetical protein [Nitrosospira sp.]